MPAGNLSSDWVRIATSGATADGREIKKEWLTSMAESYDPEFYSSKIWLDHFRFYGSQGEVLELKTEKATHEKLKGEIQLFARLAPTAELIDLNRNGQYHHVSIEPIEDFGGKGFTYLGGIGITDYPASLGTSNVQFNGGEKTSKNYMGCEKIDLSRAGQVDDDANRFFSRLKKFLKFHETQEQDTPMTPEQFAKLEEHNKAVLAALTAMTEKFSANHASAAAQAPKTENPVAESAATQAGVTVEQFTAQYDEIAAVKKSLEEFGAKLDEALGRKVPGTPTDKQGGATDSCI